ncbi:hypothetical protein E2C01_018207 [Portunus trituberculatus]|uniref:Uncharacterized protein n=1 Tax=Portunus trituberculatus TaxID=210409 RepID=A0A5B7DVT4_PORTR|nr:hypothetical protein [Portunus trituberculatus]
MLLMNITHLPPPNLKAITYDTMTGGTPMVAATPGLGMNEPITWQKPYILVTRDRPRMTKEH